jgi:hypothetical protein
VAKKKHKPVSAESLLEALDGLLQTSNYYQSRESGKRFYDQGNFPSLLASYITHSGKNVRQNARQFGMSPGTLENIIAGGPLSDNMLLRIRSALVAETAVLAKQAIFLGDWRDATPAKVSAAIADVSEKLVFLKKVIASSNFLHSQDSPIDKIQVLQLVALLTATLESLRAPFIDKKQTSGFFRWLARLAKISAEKGLEKLVVDAMGDAASAGTDLIHHLSSQTGVTDLGNIIR